MEINQTVNSKFDELGLTAAQKFTIGLHILTSFSAAIGHRPFVVKGEKTYGNLCMVLVGTTGSGKGASCRFVKEIFSGYGEDVAAPMLEATRVPSMKNLLRDIHNILSDEIREPRGEIRIYHINEEFGNELRAAGSSYQSGLGSFLCKLVEGDHISETLGRQHIEYPLIHYSFMGHIQPEELKRSMREHLISSGCANRILWFGMPEGMTTPLPRMTQEIKTELADEIEQSVRFAAHKREILLTAEAEAKYDSFSATLAEEQSESGELMQNMLPRFAQHALKIALVLTMLRRQTEVDCNAMTESIALVNKTRSVIQECFSAPVPQRIELDILGKIREVGRIQPQALYRTLLSSFKLAKIKQAISELETTGLIKLQAVDMGDGNFPKYYSLCE